MAQFSYEDRDSQSVVDGLLAKFQESGAGELNHPDPTDLATRWMVNSTFELDPVINLPGKSAFSVPTGLSPGYIKMIAKERPFLNRRYPYVCGSDRHIEHIELTLPKNVRVTQVPSGITAGIGAQYYKSTYKLSGNTLKVTREFSEEIHKDTCMPSKNDTLERLIMIDAIKADLRNQVFVQ